MTLDSLAVSGYGQDSLALQKYYNEYAQYLASMQALQGAQGVQGVQPTFTSSGSNVGYIQRAPEEKNNDATAWALLGTGLLALGATACFIRGKNVGAQGFFNRIGTGGKEIGKSIKNFFTGGSKKAASEAADVTPANGASLSQIGDDVLTVRFNSSGNQIVSIPNKTRTIAGANTATQATNLGVDLNSALSWKDKGATLERTWVEFNQGGQDVRALYDKNGGFIKVLTDKNKPLEVTSALQKQLDDIAKGLSTKNEALLNGVNLRNTRYSTMVDNAQVGYRANYNSFVNTSGATIERNGVRSLITNRYSTVDDAYKALDETTRNNVDRLSNIPALGNEGWKAGSATYTHSALGADTQIVIKNGEINGVKVGDTFYGLDTDKFRALKNTNEAIFNDIFKHQNEFANVAWIRA